MQQFQKTFAFISSTFFFSSLQTFSEVPLCLPAAKASPTSNGSKAAVPMGARRQRFACAGAHLQQIGFCTVFKSTGRSLVLMLRSWKSNTKPSVTSNINNLNMWKNKQTKQELSAASSLHRKQNNRLPSGHHWQPTDSLTLLCLDKLDIIWCICSLWVRFIVVPGAFVCFLTWIIHKSHNGNVHVSLN